MASVEDRIVRIEFDNKGFESKIQGTLDAIESLNQALEFEQGIQGLAELSSAAGSFNTSGLLGMADAVDNISSKISAMGAIGFSVIQSLTQGVLGFAKQFGGDILDPIFGGGTRRAQNIQQAQFMFRGLGIDVEQGMASALAAVQGTAYGLDEAAKAASQFGASGIAVGDDMTAALRGVAGAAAMTGASFTEIASIFAGSAATGKVNSMDLMQFATRGLNAAAGVAKAMGITEQAVRDMASNGELDFKTFAAAMDVAFGEHATKANELFSGSLANMKAGFARLGAAIMGPQLFNMRDMFNAVTPVVDNLAASIKPLIDMFSLITGFMKNAVVSKLNDINFDNLKAAMPTLVEGLKNIFETLRVIYTIGKNVFDNIFPPNATSLIQRFADGFLRLSQALIVTVSGAGKIGSIFTGFFSVLSIGWTIIKEGIGFIADLGRKILELIGPGILGGITKFGDTLGKLQESLVKEGGIKSFFEGLTKSLEKPFEILGKIKDAITELFSGFKSEAADGIGDAVGRIGDRFSGLKDILGRVWEPFITAMGTVVGALAKVGEVIFDWFAELWDKIAAGMKEGDFNAVLDAINVGLLGGIAALLYKFLNQGLKIDLSGGIFGQVNGVLRELTDTLNALQMKLKSEALMNIAIAVGLLTASVVALSLIDSEALTKALLAMSVGFGQLLAAFAVIEKLSLSPLGAVNFALIAAGMILLGGAMILLSIGIKILSTLNWEDLVIGLTGTAVGLGLLVAAVNLIPADAAMIRAGIGIMAIAAGMVILAVAMKIMATMSWDELAKGLVGVGVGLGAIVAAMNLMPPNLSLIKAGIGIMAIAVAAAILGGAVKIFATMDWESMGKGLVGFGASLGIIVAALNLMPKNIAGSVASILALSIAIVGISVAMKVIGSMSWEDIAKGIASIAISLGLLVGASLLMQSALPGAAAMVIVAGALIIIAQAIKTVGNMSWGDLIKGLVGLAVAIGLIAGASVLLVEAVPFILAFGAALLLLGAGFALVGVGAYLLAKAFAIVVKAIEETTLAIPELLEAIAEALPAIGKGLAEAFTEVAKTIAKAAPIIAKALGTLLVHITDTLIELVPKLGELIRSLLDEFLIIVEEYTEPLIAAGLHIITSFLEGMEENIGPLTTIVANIVINFINALTEKIPEFKDALVSFITTALTQAAEALGEIAGTLLLGVGIAFLTGLYNGAVSNIGPIASFMAGIAGQVLGWIGDTVGTLVEKGADFLRGLLNGAIGFIGEVAAWFGGLPGAIASFVGETIGVLLDKGRNTIEGLWNGIKEVFESVKGWLSDLPSKISNAVTGLGRALWDQGARVIEGLWNGMKSVWDDVKGWLGDVADSIGGFLSDPLSIFSPSRVMHEQGEYIFEGLSLGMQKEWAKIDKWLERVPVARMDEFTEQLSNSVSNVARHLSDLPEFTPTITPVLDLTRVAAEADRISDYILASQKLAPSSYRNALNIAAAQRLRSEEVAAAPTTPESVLFEQNIYAPTELSTSDIYKQTRNQITIAKEELSIL